MPKQPQPAEIVVTDFSGQGRDWRVTLPADLATGGSADGPPARGVSQRSSSKTARAYIPYKTKRQKTVEREARKVQNRKRWHEFHVVELTTTKRLLFKALRLLRQNKIKLTPEMAEALAHHEKWRPGRVGGRRYKKIHKFEGLKA